MNWRAMRAIIRKDLLVVLRSPMVLLPMILLPLILQILMPVGFGIAINLSEDSFTAEEADLEEFIQIVPQKILDQYEGVPEAGLMLILMLVYFFAPLYLMVPMMVASVIAADSFVGERERKTMEALLHSPLTDREMLIAKMLTAWVSAVVVALVTFGLYTISVNAVGWRFVGHIFFPNLMWLILVLWVTPATAGLGLAGTVLISSRVKTFQEAYQFGGIVVVPLVALILGQVAGVIFISDFIAFLLGVFLWVLDAVLLLIGTETFKREALLAKL